MRYSTNAQGKVSRYTYDALGHVLQSQQPLGHGDHSTTSMTYDLRGRKTQMSDPDQGTWRYTYNALGELLT